MLPTPQPMAVTKRLGTTHVDQPSAANQDASNSTEDSKEQGDPDSLSEAWAAIKQGRIKTGSSNTSVLVEPGREQPKIRLTVGRIIPGSRYRILRWLGEGGMGVVYEAEHIDIERRIALKILRFDLSRQSKMIQVFRDEARAASRIGSDHIVEIYDFGELPDGRLFYCMELLDGQDLVPASNDSWIETPTLIGHMRQICKGLGAAHRAGIVHRDIKPENIISFKRDGRDRIKIVDFGISAMLAAGDDLGTNIVGTPHYMAPEQICGAVFDGRLDMYALGCMAYELLTGAPPFDAEDIDELLDLHLHRLPRRLAEVRPDREIPDPIAKVIMRCLEKNPDDRFQDMADLEAALCEAQIESSIQTEWDDLPLPDVDDFRRERLLDLMPSVVDATPRRRWVWPMISVMSTVVAVSLAFLLHQRPATQQETDRIDKLTAQAQNAGALTYYVYPPPESPSSDLTAYRKVLALEKVTGSGEDLAQERADRLRDQFATTLVELGNKYWEVAEARGWAREYYALALLFRPDHPRAQSRNIIPPATLAMISEKARTGSFSRDELNILQWTNILADTNELKRHQRFKAAISDSSISSTRISLAKTALAAVQTTSKNEKNSKQMSSATRNRELSKAIDQILLEELRRQRDAETGVDGPSKIASVGSSGNSSFDSTRSKGEYPTPVLRRNKQESNRLTRSAEVALRKGKRTEAEKLFYKAISQNNRNTRALMGLSDVYFDSGNYESMVKYAQQAVRYSPKNHNYRLKLGDAYYKVLRYREALAEYKRANKLGDSRSKERIQKVLAKIGDDFP